MKKSILLFTFLIIYTASLFSIPRGKQDIIPAGDKIYDALTALTLEEGRNDFYESSPITIAELELLFNKIDYEALSPAGKKYYEYIEDYINYNDFSWGSDIMNLSIAPVFSLEAYYKTNEEIDWVYNRFERQPLLKTPVKFSVGDYATITTDLQFSQNKGKMNHHFNPGNIPYLPQDMDINWPDNSYFSTGFLFSPKTGVNLQVGKGSHDIGRSLTGSLIESRYMTGASYASLSFFSPKIRFNTNVKQFNVNRYYYTHNFDSLFFNKIQFSAQESLFVYAPLELRYLDPFTIFHGMAPWKEYGNHESNTCCYLTIKLSYVPFSNWRIYGIFVQDQIATAYERKNWPDDVTPNGIGFQSGIENYIPLGPGYLHNWLEFTYTDPFLYIKESPNWSLLRTYDENIGDKAVFYEWIGSPFGPDTISAQLNTSFELPQKLNVTLSYLFSARGEYSDSKLFTDKLNWGGSNIDEENIDYNYWPFPHQSDDAEKQAEAKRKQSLIAPSGTPEYINRISLQVKYYFTKSISVKTQQSFVYIINKNNELNKNACGYEAVISTSIDLPALF